MQAPESIMSPTRRSAPPNRKRRERTVYSKEQLEELKEAFLKNEYPSYQDRLRLAARLHLDEHRVQVWFKNRRAQRSRLERQQAQGGYQRAGHAPTDPGAPRTPPRPGICCRSCEPQFPRQPGTLQLPSSPQPRGGAPSARARRLQPPAGHVGPGTGRPRVRPGCSKPGPGPGPGLASGPRRPELLPRSSSGS
ncbi:LOW QUALITY PROTEIN: tetrapeptide repeat homeobox protein 2-like [Capricornis sumatraensis]|uniref:LOW QUALITY PROTEIN: tetrapeptide repeat homeobox protein 2-like n=1 Tax=Capricornis sumatraensis TaxID=34865 RepID=UPI0036050742